jgi:teichuronic acid exporter
VTLRNQVVSGLKWSAAGRFGSQLLSWAATIVVIRLLAPADYGLMAIIAVIIAFLTHINELGLGSALVQSREIDNEQAGAVFGAMLLLGTTLSVVLALAGPAIASFYDEPRLAMLVAVAGLQFIVNAIAVIPDSMLRRSLDFRSLALADLVWAICNSLVTLWLAIIGWGVWALVLGNLFGAAIHTLILTVLNKRRVWPNLRLRKALGLLSFGGYMTASRYAWFFMYQADILIGSKLLGKEALGLYSVSVHLATLPMQKAMGIISQVGFSAVSRMQDRAEHVHAGLAKAIRLLAYLMLPLLCGLACVAPEFIGVVLGDNWGGAVVPLQIVALTVPLRMLSVILSTVVTGLGRADVDLRNTLTGLIVMPLCFTVGAQWGANGLAASWLFAVPAVLLLNYPRTRKVVGLTITQLCRLIAQPLLATVIMSAALITLRFATQDEFAAWVRLGLLFITGTVTYSVAAWLLDPQLREDIRATSIFRRISAGLAH